MQELIDRGALSEQEARRHPRRSVVLRALDGSEQPPPPLTATPARAGDRLLLCSDGVSDHLTDSELAELLGAHAPGRAARAIVDAALAAGSRDNVTAVVADLVAGVDGWLDALPPAPAVT